MIRMSGSSPGINIISTSALKRRKVVEKRVVTVRVGAAASAGKQKSEGPPSDPWSWRKYGQKPIKGSPYPRGYYRCSTSKGCSAKKQVERCRTDTTLLIITYTSDHNHPSLNLPSAISSSPLPQSHCTEEEEEEEEEEEGDCSSPNDRKLSTSTARGKKGLNDGHSSQATELELEVKTSTDLKTASPSSSCGDSDFFDELEELPASSSLATALQIGNFFDERVLLPSQSMPIDAVWSWSLLS